MIESKEIANPAIENLKKVITEALDKEFSAQGHRMTNSLIEGIEYKKEYKGKNLEISVLMKNYGVILETGVPKEKIPYNPTIRTGAGTSKYIQALANYAKQRMGARSEATAKSIAFAIARKHWKEGMPTKGSYAFSQTGKRTEWIEEAFKKNEDKIMKAIEAIALDSTSVTIELVISKFQREINQLA